MRGNKQKRSTNPVIPTNRIAAAAAAAATPTKKRKPNDDDDDRKAREAARGRERRLKVKLETLESKHVKEAIEATSKAEHTITVAYEKQQQEHSKIQSVTAAQLNKYKDMNDNLKDRNLKSRTTTNIRIATLKQNHRKELSTVKKKNTKSMNRVKSDAYHVTMY